jgi:hypothetical protein
MLLAHWLWSKCKDSGSKLAVVASTVSSKMTGALAQKEGMRYGELNPESRNKRGRRA